MMSVVQTVRDTETGHAQRALHILTSYQVPGLREGTELNKLTSLMAQRFKNVSLYV